MILQEAVTTEDMADVRRLRQAVFVDEQNVPGDLEWDGQDGRARHLLMRDGAQPVATLRWRELGPVAKVERVCVARPWRGRNLGAKLMQRALAEIAATSGLTQVRLGAQVPVIGFYARLGFVAEGPVYDDAGIPHRDMVMRLESP